MTAALNEETRAGILVAIQLYHKSATVYTNQNAQK